MELHHGVHMIWHCDKKRANPNTPLLAILDRFKHLAPNLLFGKLVDTTSLATDRDEKCRVFIPHENGRRNFML
jgi:hypothetical protein